ncbi:MAG: RNA polymerase sigma factor [Candidatus Paceibacterota bacterium]
MKNNKTNKITNQQDKFDRVEKAFSEHSKKIYKYFMLRVPKNEALDLASDTFLVLLKNIDKVYLGDELPYLYKVASNLNKNYHKTNKKRSLTLQILTNSPSTTQPNLELYAAVAKLPLLDQEILLLQVLDNLSTNEISEIINISPSATRKKLSRIKKKLAEIYITQ